MKFRAGDVVKHFGTGEKWRLIVDEYDGTVVPGGWPDTRAKAIDCELLKAATDAERLAQLQSTSESRHSARGIAVEQLKGTDR